MAASGMLTDRKPRKIAMTAGIRTVKADGWFERTGIEEMYEVISKARRLLDRDIPCWDPLDKGRVG